MTKADTCTDSKPDVRTPPASPVLNLQAGVQVDGDDEHPAGREEADVAPHCLERMREVVQHFVKTTASGGWSGW